MKNPLFRAILKAWIAIASIGAFVFGWVVLGHTNQPVDTSGTPLDKLGGQSQVAPLPTLEPLPTFDSSSGASQSLQPLQQSQPSFSFNPGFRSRGS